MTEEQLFKTYWQLWVKDATYNHDFGFEKEYRRAGNYVIWGPPITKDEFDYVVDGKTYAARAFLHGGVKLWDGIKVVDVP